jgi:hypothetical protein
MQGTREPSRIRRRATIASGAGVLAAIVIVAGLVDAPSAHAADPGAPEDYPLTVVLGLGSAVPVQESHDELLALGRTQMQAMADYWAAQSGGVVQPRVVSVEWADVDNDGQPDVLPCSDANAARAKVNDARADLGYVPGPRGKFAYFVVAGCGFGAWATKAWMYAQQGGAQDQQNGVLAHEFGHTIGLDHAQLYVCADGAVDGEVKANGGTCTVTDYFDRGDVMGSSLRDVYGDLSTPNAIVKGFIRSPDFVEVAGSSDQTIVLNNRNLLSGLRAARVTDPIDGREYYVEYSREAGYSQGYRTVGQTFPIDGMQVRTGWGVRVLKRAGDATQALVAPTGTDGIRNTYWRPGEEFVSVSGGIRVEVVAQDATTATLRIRTNADITPPAAPAELSSDGSVVQGTAEPNLLVSVHDVEGRLVGTAATDATGAFVLELTTTQTNGRVLAVSVTDAAGLTSSVGTVAVVRPLGLSFSTTAVTAGESQTIIGTGFLPRELVSATMTGVQEPFAETTADETGVVTFTFPVPRTALSGMAEITLTGPSGSVSGAFQVSAAQSSTSTGEGTGDGGMLPVAGVAETNRASGPAGGALALTGGETAPLLWGAGALLLAIGAALSFALRRRSHLNR